MTPEQMRKTAFENSVYIKLKSGEKFIGVAKNCETVKSLQDPTKSTYLYTFDIAGKEKFFKSSSNVLLNTMADLMGKKIEVLRRGEGTDTKYEVALIAE